MLIGIGHRSGHGKDTLADFIVKHLQIKYPQRRIFKYPFAWKIKQIAFDLYKQHGLREPAFYETPQGRALRDIKLPVLNLTPVEIWIKIGTPCFREQIYAGTWTDYVFELSRERGVIIVAPDVRFPEEHTKCDHLVHCINPRVPNREGLSVDEVLEDFNGWSYTILNNGTLEDLENSGRHYVCTLKL